MVRTLGGILATGGTLDVVRLGWPTLRAGFPLMTFLNTMREIRTALATRAAKDTAPVMAVIGAGNGEDRSIAALNVALSAARDGARVLLIDADQKTYALSNKVAHLAKEETGRLGWLNIGAKAARAIKTANGISILPAVKASDTKASDTIRKAIAQARSAAATIWWSSTGPPCRGARPTTRCSTPPTGWSRSCRSSSTSTRAWKTSSPRSARPSASWSVSSSTNSPPRPSTVSETNSMRERRLNPLGRAATAGVPRITLGGLRLAVLDLEQTADFMIDMVFPQRRLARPLYLTSANGEVLARCSTEPMTDRLFRSADLINADGQPLVTVSRLKSSTPLPERVATTDLFHVVARKAQAAGLTFYMFGADEAENAAAVANVRRLYPDLKIIGHSHGFLRGDALRAKVDEINALAPDYLWLALGVPYEQAFVEEYTSRLFNVGVIKTSGGLFNFLSGSRARAPYWMQAVGLEWAWRIWLEPRRLFWRYFTTNPRALYLLFNKSRPSATDRARD